VEIALKANPKAKYEVSDSLIELARGEPRLCLLPLAFNMAEAQRHCVGTVTITGTVGYEAVFGKGRALSLGHPLIEREFPGFHADSPQAAVKRLLEEPAAGVGNIQTGTRLMQCFVAESFPGLVSDPLSDPACLEPSNVGAVAQALHAVFTGEAGRPRLASTSAAPPPRELGRACGTG
jgi:hypothetical protein